MLATVSVSESLLSMSGLNVCDCLSRWLYLLALRSSSCGAHVQLFVSRFVYFHAPCTINLAVNLIVSGQVLGNFVKVPRVVIHLRNTFQYGSVQTCSSSTINFNLFGYSRIASGQTKAKQRLVALVYSSFVQFSSSRGEESIH